MCSYLKELKGCWFGERNGMIERNEGSLFRVLVYVRLALMEVVSHCDSLDQHLFVGFVAVLSVHLSTNTKR
jgi:hypothetical protein